MTHSSPLLRRWLPLAILFLVGVAVYLPAVRTPLYLDDFNQAAMVHGTYPAPRGPLDLYDFVNAADRPALLARGVLPWWTDPTLRVRFLRPLSSALLWVDYRLFGQAPLLPHLHSLAWWVAAVLAAHALFRRLIPRRGAIAATFIFALAPCHAVPLAWLANREALVSLTFGVLALGAYLRWREGRALRDGVLAAALFGATLAAGEYGLGFAGYVVALEGARRGDRASTRITGLLPFVVPSAAYLSIHYRWGYGATGLGFYADPVSNPAAFLRAAPANLSALLLEAWFTIGGGQNPWWALLLLAVLVAAAVRGLLPRLDAAQRHAVAWMVPGSILALLPVLATAPSSRLLGASVLGIAGFTGLLVDRAWLAPSSADRRTEDTLLKVAATALAIVQTILAPMAGWTQVRSFHQEAVRFSARARVLRSQLAGRNPDEIVVVRSLGAGFILPFLAVDRGPALPRWRVLSETGHVLVMRTGARSMELVAPPGLGLFPFGPANLVRDTRRPTRVGEVFRVPGMRATVLEVAPLGPRRVRFDFDEDLDPARVAAAVEDLAGFRSVTLPAPGTGAPFKP